MDRRDFIPGTAAAGSLLLAAAIARRATGARTC